VYWLAPAYRERTPSLRIPFFEDFARAIGATPREGAVILKAGRSQGLLVWLAWGLLVVALARPQWVGDPIVRTESGRDLLMAVDLSGSMETRDFLDEDGELLSRLEVAKHVLDDFMTQRGCERIGLVFFGTAPFLQVPFTQDHQTCRALLQEAQVRMAGPQTMVGDAIGLAIRLFENSTVVDRILILLTDGNDTGSKVPPAEAARIAAERNIRIYSIAIGDPKTIGEEELDVEALQEIAQVTGGRFFHANDREELQAAYARVDDLEPAEFETFSYRPKTPLFQWPLAGFLVLGLGYHAIVCAKGFRRVHHGTYVNFKGEADSA
jgi:Ca-activated chloride channel family protein